MGDQDLSPNGVQKLLDLESIRLVKARYCRLIDEKSWDELRTVFTEDVTFCAGEHEIHGVDPLIDLLRSSLVRYDTVHRAHMPELDLLSEGLALGTWAMFEIVKPLGEGARRIIYGRCRDEYRKTDGRWQISRLTTRQLYSE